MHLFMYTYTMDFCSNYVIVVLFIFNTFIKAWNVALLWPVSMKISNLFQCSVVWRMVNNIFGDPLSLRRGIPIGRWPPKTVDMKKSLLHYLCHGQFSCEYYKYVRVVLPQKLTVLKMRSNRLVKIPVEFGDLTSLELACFAQNMIKDFPFDKVSGWRGTVGINASTLYLQTGQMY